MIPYNIWNQSTFPYTVAIHTERRRVSTLLDIRKHDMKTVQVRGLLESELEELHRAAAEIKESVTATGWGMRAQLGRGEVLYFPIVRMRGTSLEISWHRMGRKGQHQYVAKGRDKTYSAKKFRNAPGWLVQMIVEVETKWFGPIRERAQLVARILADVNRLENLQRDRPMEQWTDT